MGYRELLKAYIRHLEVVAGDNYIEQIGTEPMLNPRDLGELRTLAAEVCRDGFRGERLERVESYNFRLRVLMNRHALSADRVADLMGLPRPQVRCWRTNPNSARYQRMSEEDFTRFEAALTRWLETSGH